jgi:hypothetical protein
MHTYRDTDRQADDVQNPPIRTQGDREHVNCRNLQIDLFFTITLGLPSRMYYISLHEKAKGLKHIEKQGDDIKDMKYI